MNKIKTFYENHKLSKLDFNEIKKFDPFIEDNLECRIANKDYKRLYDRFTNSKRKCLYVNKKHKQLIMKMYDNELENIRKKIREVVYRK